MATDLPCLPFADLVLEPALVTAHGVPKVSRDDEMRQQRPRRTVRRRPRLAFASCSRSSDRMPALLGQFLTDVGFPLGERAARSFGTALWNEYVDGSRRRPPVPQITDRRASTINLTIVIRDERPRVITRVIPRARSVGRTGFARAPSAYPTAAEFALPR